MADTKTSEETLKKQEIVDDLEGKDESLHKDIASAKADLKESEAKDARAEADEKNKE